ncbi:MAG: AAA family ATPase [Cytophagales bacterium]|nr:AAA family ATPase [Cytophagales bacterium]
MKISELRISRYRCFHEITLPFSPTINVLAGSNNSGKSSILKCLLELQEPSISRDDIRKNEDQLYFAIDFGSGWLSNRDGTQFPNCKTYEFLLDHKQARKSLRDNNGTLREFSQHSNIEPNNIIYPFLSKRKTNAFEQTINQANTTTVKSDLSLLYAKIDRLASSGHSKHEIYKEACQQVLGFNVYCQASGNGKRAGFSVNDVDFISIESMGEGVSSLLGIIVNLCVATKKIFIIEELENDIHPRALKALLHLILDSSATNQFFISTHSNIVVRMLGAASDTKIFGISSQIKNSIPTSIVTEFVDPEKRRELLDDLGYDLSDFGLWKGWLILEESSAETIINSFLIPWFAPGLIGRLRTISSGGYHRAKNKFDKLHDHFLFLHLTPVYKNKAWVILDGGESEGAEILKLKRIYVEKHKWNEEHFLQLSKHDFEDFYPLIFQEKVATIKSLSDKEKQVQKTQLLIELSSWVQVNLDAAKDEFSSSFAEIISILKKIETSVRLN